MDSPFNLDQIEIIDGVKFALEKIKEYGYKVIIVTNQPGAAKEKVSLETLNLVHNDIVGTLSGNKNIIDESYICFHHPNGKNPELTQRCNCRKPNVQHFNTAINKYDIDISRSFMVGDSKSDIVAGNSLGLKTILVGELKCDRCGMFQSKESLPTYHFRSLSEFADALPRLDTSHYRKSYYEGRTQMKKVEDLAIKVFADGANIADFLALKSKPYIEGFTTNPTLISKANVKNYEEWAKDVLSIIEGMDISFEVVSDCIDEMKIQAKKLSSWGENVFVKIPITNTKGESTLELVKELSKEGVRLNITAVMTLKQTEDTFRVLDKNTRSIISIFAGRIADTGRDPVPLMKKAKSLIANSSNIELLWASPRELLNIYHAEECMVDIITVTPAILAKIDQINYDLDEFSLDTVKMFYNDAVKANLTI